MKRYFLLLFLFLFLRCSYGQSLKIDSLKKLITASNSDTQKINLSNNILYTLSEINIDSSNILAGKNIENSKKINYKQGEADALRLFAANLARQGNYTSAIKNLNSSESLISELNDSSRIAKIYAVYGMIYGMQGKNDTSIQFYQKSISITESLGNLKDLGTYYGNIAINYQMQSNFAQAVVYQLKSLHIAEQQNDANGQAYTLMNLGNTYQALGDTARAEKALLKGIQLAKSVGIKNVELYGYSNLASLYAFSKRWSESYTYAQRSADLAKIMGDAGIQSASMSKAALALANMKEFTAAETLNKKAIAIADASKQPFNIFQTYSGMGQILILEEKYEEATSYLEKSLRVLSSADMYDENVQVTYAALSVCYEKTGEFNKALIAFKTSSKISDSIKSKENVRKAMEIALNNEFEQKQKITEAIQGKKNAEAKLNQLLLFGGLIITLIIAAGAWQTVRNKQKANTILKQQKEEIQNTLSMLTSTQSQLIQVEKMASLGELTAGIAHEIQNPLNFVKNFSEVSAEMIDEMEEEIKAGNEDNVAAIRKELKDNLEKVTHHSMRADAIVKSMLLHSRASSGEREFTDINELTDEYLRLSFHGLKAKEKSFNAKIDTHFDAVIGKINIAPQDVGRVLFNLFNNAFYAVKEKKKIQPDNYNPSVSASTKKINNLIEISVKDNGTGIPSKIIDKIYQPFFTTKPTGQGTGLGLSLSYDIIKAHGGKIKVESKEGEGTEFIIQLPVIL